MMVNSKTEAHIASLENDYQKICDMALNAKKEKVVSEWIAKKQKTTYVSINEDYQKCPFKFTGWLKNN